MLKLKGKKSDEEAKKKERNELVEKRFLKT
jgi:hypothetical protein